MMDEESQTLYEEVEGLFQKFLAQLIIVGVIPRDKREIANKVLEDNLQMIREGLEQVE